MWTHPSYSANRTRYGELPLGRKEGGYPAGEEQVAFLRPHRAAEVADGRVLVLRAACLRPIVRS